MIKIDIAADIPTLIAAFGIEFGAQRFQLVAKINDTHNVVYINGNERRKENVEN